MNVFTFSGNVGRDPELKFLPSGDPVLTFSVAVSSGFGDKKTNSWIEVTKFGKGAEALGNYISKGSNVGVSGELKVESWTNKDGIEKQRVKVTANSIDLPPKGESKPSDRQQAKHNEYNDMRDDIPF